MADRIQLGNRIVGKGNASFLIAEVGMAHDGSLGLAHAYIDATAMTGVDAIKFQTHIAEEESTSAERFRVNVFPQDTSRFDYWKRTEFSKSQWQELSTHAREKGLIFLSSPFSNLAVDWLEDCKVPAWKVASGELTNYPMLKRMCETGKPLLVSSGMSSWKELTETINYIESNNGSFGIFQCTTAYPCPPEKWGLNVIKELIAKYSCPIGLSDHSGTATPSIVATALGATMLEFHVAFSKKQFGPDAKASLTFEEVMDLVHAVRQVSHAMNNPIDKDLQAEMLAPLHDLFAKSIVASRELPSGQVLTEEDVAFKKPGTGISTNRLTMILGKKLKSSVGKDHIFCLEDFLP